jgi:hypothetical protein
MLEPKRAAAIQAQTAQGIVATLAIVPMLLLVDRAATVVLCRMATQDADLAVQAPPKCSK